MKKSFIFCVCLFCLSCTTKNKPADVNLQLKSAMADYLNTDPKSKGLFKYDVTSVVFFDDTKYYICEFKVHMTNEISAQNARRIDTTGDMKVKIDKNFKVISRYY
ncbi:MAG: hypothetical protein NTZ19_01245 [Bacteroidetes bacterium]|nr:hypothetical protein [Bacteroidota bacterium]